MKCDVVELKTINEVGLPLDPETFSRVILDFLGRKENLSYKSHDNFIINLEDISQFNHIFSVHDKFHRTLILSGFCLLKIAKISLNSSFFPKPIKR